MRLLIVTQAVDQEHPVLGFFHEWIERFSDESESVEVICLYEGAHALPAHVRVHSLGKEGGRRLKLSYAFTFFRYVWKLRGSYDAVFVHMNPEYVVLAGWFWRLLQKRVALWYLHKRVSWRLRLAVYFTDIVFTASPESMRITTPKKRVVGHGLPVGHIPFLAAPQDGAVSLITVGRLSPVKRVDLLIQTLALLPESMTLTIVGAAAGETDSAYVATLHALVEELNLSSRVTFAGSQTHASLDAWYMRAHLFVHASDTGSLDKVLLEALARGIPVITTNYELAKDAGEPIAYGAAPAPELFATRIEEVAATRPWAHPVLRERAREYVRSHHDLGTLVKTITTALDTKI